VSTVKSTAGLFSLVTPVDGHGVGTLVQVAVPTRRPSRVVLDFIDDHCVLTDASVLLCGQIGALALLECGYTGPLIRRPRLAART
jgi:hypothetical protein